MAIAKVQHDHRDNGTSQTTTETFPATPTQGNLLIVCLGHDEASVNDQATVTSAGWVRMATFEDASDPGRRVHVFAKIAGASEPTGVDVDFGEVNRRGHVWVIEFSGFNGTLPSEDAAASSGGYTNGATSQQPDSAVPINTGNLAIALMFTMSEFTGGSLSFDGGFTTIEDFQDNFRGSGVGWKEGDGSDEQPEATWTGSEEVTMILVEVGEAPTPPPKPHGTQLQPIF